MVNDKLEGQMAFGEGKGKRLARIIHDGSLAPLLTLPHSMGEGEEGGSRTAGGGQGTGSAVCGGACPAPRTGTGARKKGASPQPYGEGPRGEPAGRRLVVAVDPRLQQKRS